MTFMHSVQSYRFYFTHIHRRLAGLLGAWMICAMLGGCGEPPPQTDSVHKSATEPVTLSLANPSDAARSALRVIRQELEAHAHHDRAAQTDARARLRTLVAWKTIRDSVTRGRPASEKALALFENRLLDSWVAILLFYRDGIELDRAELVSQTDTRAIVRIPVHQQIDGRNYRAAVRVETIRQNDGTWLVSQITFFGRKGEHAPATAPTGVSDHAPPAD